MSRVLRLQRREQLAWAAGMFEGEGCISHDSGKRGTARALTLVSTDRDVLHTFARVVGVGVIRERGVRGRRKASWRWEVRRWRDIEPLLRKLLPYLGARRRAKALALLADPATRQGTICRNGHALRGAQADVYRYPGRAPQCAICAREYVREKRRAA